MYQSHQGKVAYHQASHHYKGKVHQRHQGKVVHQGKVSQRHQGKVG